jgi:hypothetical protein
MSRPSIVGSALVAIVAVSLVILGPWGAIRAQGDRSLYVNVTELRYGWNENLPDGGTCSFTGQQFGYLSTVPMQIVVEDEAHRTVAVRDVGGTIRHNEGEDWYRCDATFDLPLPDAEFYTVRINDVYHSTFAAGQAPFASVIIVLESGESWRPAA